MSSIKLLALTLSWPLTVTQKSRQVSQRGMAGTAAPTGDGGTPGGGSTWDFEASVRCVLTGFHVTESNTVHQCAFLFHRQIPNITEFGCPKASQSKVPSRLDMACLFTSYGHLVYHYALYKWFNGTSATFSLSLSPPLPPIKNMKHVKPAFRPKNKLQQV